MRTATTTLICLLVIGYAAHAQDCPVGPADTLPNAGGQALDGMPLHWSPSQVSQAVPRVLRDLHYRVAETSYGATRFVTAVSHTYPDEPLLSWFRDYPHPGIVVTVVVQAEEDSTRLVVLARSLCAVDRPPPPGHPGKVEDILEMYVAQQVAFGVVDRLRRDYPKPR